MEVGEEGAVEGVEVGVVGAVVGGEEGLVAWGAGEDPQSQRHP